MALLNRGRRGLAFLLLVAGCYMVSPQAAAGPHFSHARHLEGTGFTCVQCHTGVTTGNAANMPGPQLCMPCHADFDGEKPLERQLAAFFDGDGRYLAQPVATLPDEVIFSHAAHNGVTCAECHGDIARSDAIPASSAVSKGDCLDCHARVGRRDDCADCHRSISADWAPPTHGQAWDVHHGQVVHSRDESIQNRCDLCHEKSSCEACHREVLPRSHNNFWRIRGHGIATSINRNSCFVCHRQDSCEQCHQATRPRSHSGSFGSTMNRHCAGCHFPLRGEGCATCHKSAPSHDLATPLPTNHNPAMNCRACHGAGVSLPHLDGGHACTNCHR